MLGIGNQACSDQGVSETSKLLSIKASSRKLPIILASTISRFDSDIHNVEHIQARTRKRSATILQLFNSLSPQALAFQASYGKKTESSHSPTLHWYWAIKVPQGSQ